MLLNRYFRESKQIVPSPWDEIPRKQIIPPKDSTPMRSGLKNSVDVEKRDNACQTVLSLPPTLPPEVEQVLRPFFTFTEDQQQLCNNINENLMNASLCRRLFHFSSEDESIDSTNSSVKSGDLPPFQSPKLVSVNRLKNDLYTLKKKNLFYIENIQYLQTCNFLIIDFFGLYQGSS